MAPSHSSSELLFVVGTAGIVMLLQGCGGGGDSPTPAPTPPPKALYFLQTTGKCTEAIGEMSECSAAAAVLGLSDTTAQDDGQMFGRPLEPPWCYFEGLGQGGDLKFNIGSNTGECTVVDKCLCKTPTCGVQDCQGSGLFHKAGTDDFTSPTDDKCCKVCYNTDGAATDNSGDHCSGLIAAAYCGYYDDTDFKSNEMCCVCGGGSSEKPAQATIQFAAQEGASKSTYMMLIAMVVAIAALAYKKLAGSKTELAESLLA